MINEWEEFCAYTGTVSYTASKKSDTTWLGRFTFATILEFEGMARILTVLARGYLFHSKDGAVIWGNPHDRIDYARRALCAWCSVPEDGKRVQDKEWQFQTDFSELHTEFPELVDADGVGWFLRHVLRAADFMLTHPERCAAPHSSMRRLFARSLPPHGETKYYSIRSRFLHPKPRAPGHCALMMSLPMRWSWGRCAERSRSCRLN